MRWSPCWEARKIRCRRLRTRRSACRQSTVFQSVCAVAPLTVVCPKLSPRSAILTSFFGRSTGSASAVFRPLRSRGPVQPVRGARPGSRCLSAAGFRFSDPPPPAGDFGLPHGRLTGGGAARPHRGFHVPHDGETIGVGAFCTPGPWCSRWGQDTPQVKVAQYCRVIHRLRQPWLTTLQTKVPRVTRPIFTSSRMVRHRLFLLLRTGRLLVPHEEAVTELSTVPILHRNTPFKRLRVANRDATCRRAGAASGG